MEPVLDWIHAGVRYPNAVQEQTGVRAWRVPVKDLLAAGDLDHSQVVEVPAVLESLRVAKQVGQLRARIVELETALAVQTARAEERQALLGTLQALLPRWRWQGPVPGSPYANTFSSAFCVTFGAASPVTARST